jgi:hypothetical protein
LVDLATLRRMFPAAVLRRALCCGAVALSVSACGIASKPEAGTLRVDSARGSHARVDDPRTKHVTCLRADGLPVRLYRASGGRPAIQVGTAPSGPTVVFEPTPGDAQGVQITGRAQGAEVIGSALLYPNAASDAQLSEVEGCVALGVKG